MKKRHGWLDRALEHDLQAIEETAILLTQRFRELGLIDTHAQHSLVVRDRELSDYLARIASC